MTVINEDAIGSLRRITMENEAVCARFLPELGAKMTSLVRLETGHEFLLQPQRPLRRASYGESFVAFDTSGFDECVPTVSACRLPGGQSLPDHGELWSIPWQATVSGDQIQFEAAGRALSYRFTKSVHLNASQLVIDYELRNEGGERMPFLWSAHPLLTVEPGSQIVLPPEVGEMFVSYSLGDRLGGFGGGCGWPVAHGNQGSERLDILRPAAAGFADKLFTGSLSEGYCALVKPDANESISLRFDPALVPYLGVWICQGGWPDPRRGHYTVALEPCRGRPDSLSEAIVRGENDALAAGATKRWTLRIELSAAGKQIDQSAVRRQIGRSR